MDRSKEIQHFILQHVNVHANDIVAYTMQRFNVTRTTVLRHLQHLIKKKEIIKTGNTRDVLYTKSDSINKKINIKLANKTDEFQIVRSYFHDVMSQLNKNILDISEYGLTEMINNAIDHSLGKNVVIETNIENNNILLTVKDDGIGIFKKISTLLNASDEREAVLQLNKGKFTSDPINHTGEGIFFCSRLFDEFQLIANGLCFTRYNPENDWFLEHINTKNGTLVKMKIDIYSSKKIIELFKNFQDPESYEFNTTEILVALCKLGSERYISRSQAKRILKNLAEFKTIILDFKNITTIGQGFVDEVFRVYQAQHPNINIKYINTNEDVLFMIKRGLSNPKA